MSEQHEEHSAATVYGRPQCVQCEYTTRVMKKEGIPYNYIDIEQNQVAHEEVKNRANGTQLPLVVSGQDQWQGFRPDKIRSLKRDGS